MWTRTLLGWLVASALVTGCGDSSSSDKAETTAVLLTVLFDPQAHTVDQFRFEGYRWDATETFEPDTFPQTASDPFTSGEESVLIILPDETAGELLLLRAHGLHRGAVVASGQKPFTPALHQTVSVVITLGEPAVCGDEAVRTDIEECDDGNLTDGDGCSQGCIVEQGWICHGEPSACTPICGDGLLRGGETCDDNNLTNGDGCSAACAIEEGWECSDEPSACVPVCGDGLPRGDEQCDDGNTDGGDGCSAACQVEPGWQCSGEPSICVFACSDDSECEYICDESIGYCVSESDILFVDCNSTDCPGSGTAAHPYCSLQQAVADAAQDGQFILVFPGVCQEYVQIDSVGVNIVGQTGATIQSTNCPAVRMVGVEASIEGLIIQGEWVGSYHDGGGVMVSGGARGTLIGNEIADGDCIGIHCQDSVCTIHRNLVVNYSGGGINIEDSDFNIANNIVVKNGNDLSATWGGVRIDADNSSVAEFVNNTVADNRTDSTGNDPGGVNCVTQAALTNCIFWNNSNDEVSGNCTVAFSDISQLGFAGNNGNINDNPRFVNPTADDYHIRLAPLSPCVDAGSATGAPLVDFDGDARPMGNGVDMGADEAG